MRSDPSSYACDTPPPPAFCYAEDELVTVVDRRGKPSVIIMSVRDYIRNVAPTPAAYRAIRQEAKRNGASALSMREIDREIGSHRKQSATKIVTIDLLLPMLVRFRNRRRARP